MIFHAKKLNYGQSEIWVNDEPKRIVATNAIRNVFVSVGDSDEARSFGAQCIQMQPNEQASFESSNVAAIATELGLLILGR